MAAGGQRARRHSWPHDTRLWDAATAATMLVKLPGSSEVRRSSPAGAQVRSLAPCVSAGLPLNLVSFTGGGFASGLPMDDAAACLRCPAHTNAAASCCAPADEMRNS